MIVRLLVSALKAASDKLRAATEKLRAAQKDAENTREQASRPSPDLAVVLCTCAKCGAFRLESSSWFETLAPGYPRKCAMCGETACPILVNQLPVGSCLWTDGQVKVRTPANELVINRGPVKL